MGPERWLPAAGADAATLTSDPQEALSELAAGLATDAPEARLVLVHQDLFAGANGADRLTTWLEAVRDLRGPFLTVLLHGNLAAEPLVRFFRAGLFDAVALPVDRPSWVNLLIRAERRLETWAQSRRMLATSGQTRDLLQRMRAELAGSAAAEEPAPAHLDSASESLEAANRQLTDAMAELSLLYRFGRELSTARNWDQVLRDLLRSLGDFTGAGGAALILRSAPGGGYSPRQTWRWDESAWDKVLVNLNDQVDGAVAESIMAPGVFRIDPQRANGGRGRRIIALPLEHQQVRLGYLLLLFGDPEARDAASSRYLPFLQAVQVVVAEEVAGAQMLDRIRDIGAFNTRVLETVSSAIWVLGEDGRTVYCNRAGQELLTGQETEPAIPDSGAFEIGRGPGVPVSAGGDTPELLQGRRLVLDDLQGDLLGRLREAGETGFRGEGSVRSETGASVPVLVRTSLMPGRREEERWLVVVAEDLTLTRRLEAQRTTVERLEGLVEMSATLAHEIRNPLMGLSAQAELLAGQLPEGDGRTRYLDVITREVERIDGTITRMLNFVRPYEPERAPCRLESVLRDVQDLARPRCEAAGVELVLEAPVAGRLSADGDQLKQVALNLAFNAVDASPVGGVVTVSLSEAPALDLPGAEPGTRRAAAGLVLEVRDEGPGVAEADRERIFRPFFTTKNTGTGLGLALCRKIVNAHGGEILVARRDDATVFTVTLPVAAGGGELRAQEEAS